MWRGLKYEFSVTFKGVKMAIPILTIPTGYTLQEGMSWRWIWEEFCNKHNLPIVGKYKVRLRYKEGKKRRFKTCWVKYTQFYCENCYDFHFTIVGKQEKGELFRFVNQ